jgi:hypothetical protein
MCFQPIGGVNQHGAMGYDRYHISTMTRLITPLLRAGRRLAAMPRKAVTFPSSRHRKSDGPPIFIVGCPRSGTTLMRQILDSHSRIACPGETWFLIGMLEQLRNRFFISGLESLHVDRDEAVRNIRSLALHYYESFLYRSGKARWADKTPLYVTYCAELLEVFGDVRFVYLLRHGMDVVQSMQERSWLGLIPGGDDPDPTRRLEAAARQWMVVTDTFDRFSQQHPSLCHTVRFEELTTEPERIVRGVLDFLGEPWEAGILNYQAYPHSGGGDVKTPQHDGIRPNSGRYLAWPREQQESIRTLLSGHLRRYGYTEAG